MQLARWVPKQPLVVERWRLGEDIAEVATVGGKGGPATLEALGFEKCERAARR